MPSEDTAKKDSNFKIIALVAVFLLASIIAILFYYYNYATKDSSSNSGQESNYTYNDNTWTTYISKTHGYSISYPKTWSKSEIATSNESSGDEIILLNLTDRESRSNGKPNLIIYAGSDAVFCDPATISTCKEETVNLNSGTAKKYTIAEDITYVFSNGVWIFAAANGDQTTIDDVIKTYKII